MIKISRNTILSIIALAAVVGFMVYAENTFNPYLLRILNLCAVYTIFAVTFNLVYGFTGQFSLGHAGFAAVGAYIGALLTMSPAQKQANFFLEPIVPFLANIELPFILAIIIGGLGAALVGSLVAWPALRLKGDYLAIATLGFSEIIRVLLVNMQPVTNGALGLKGIPEYTNLYWSWGLAAVCIFVCKRLVDSNYGHALKAIRDDEIVAEALGVRLSYHKMLAFFTSAFFIGTAGVLFANLISTIDPKVFLFSLAYQIVGITVMGGMGSLTGSVIGAFLYTIFLEFLRPIESPFNIGSIQVPGIPGMRMVIFSFLLLMVILFYRRGLMGNAEFNWDWVVAKVGSLRGLFGGRGKVGSGPAGKEN